MILIVGFPLDDTASPRRKTDQVSQDELEIRLHRYKQILAVKWPGDEHWLIIWPSPCPTSRRKAR